MTFAQVVETSVALFKMRNGERGTGNGESENKNGEREWGTGMGNGNGEREWGTGMGNGERGTGNL